LRVERREQTTPGSATEKQRYAIIRVFRLFSDILQIAADIFSSELEKRWSIGK